MRHAVMLTQTYQLQRGDGDRVYHRHHHTVIPVGDPTVALTLSNAINEAMSSTVMGPIYVNSQVVIQVTDAKHNQVYIGVDHIQDLLEAATSPKPNGKDQPKPRVADLKPLSTGLLARTFVNDLPAADDV